MRPSDTTGRAAEIARLNDRLRRSFSGGRMVVTAGVHALQAEEMDAVIEAVKGFAAFTPDNDPHDEHDCAALMVGGAEIIWKIDYYDRDLQFASPDPTDPDITIRVLTIMLVSEY